MWWLRKYHRFPGTSFDWTILGKNVDLVYAVELRIQSFYKELYRGRTGGGLPRGILSKWSRIWSSLGVFNCLEICGKYHELVESFGVLWSFTARWRCRLLSGLALDHSGLWLGMERVVIRGRGVREWETIQRWRFEGIFHGGEVSFVRDGRNTACLVDPGRVEVELSIVWPLECQCGEIPAAER